MFYIVGTAIGNIEDTSLRTVKTLVQSDIILVEDTRTFDSFYKRIQELFNIASKREQQIAHFHQENEFEKLPWIVEQITAGKIISLVSESGLPTISDPGGTLVKYLTKVNISFTVIPGPTAFTTAAVLSGFPVGQILFLGFLPKKKSQTVQLLESLVSIKSKQLNPTVVFYESPHRINETLEIISEILPNAQLAICREITKKFEAVTRGKAHDFHKTNFKGEITVVLNVKV